MHLCRLVPRGLLCLALVLLSAPLMAGEPELPSSPLGQNYPLFKASLDEQNENEVLPIPDPKGDLSLQQAQSMALQHNAALAAQAWELEGETGRVEQAGLLPNPELAVEVENFAGDNGMEGFDSAETTLALSQLVELGGKRSKRQQSAALQKTTAAWDHEAKRLDVLTEVTKAYVEVVAAQKGLELAKRLADLAGEVNQTVIERVEAGKISPVEQTRSAVVVASARLAVENARRDLDDKRRALSVLWGSDQPQFSQATDMLKTSTGLPSLARIKPLVRHNPDVARWDAELERSRAELALAQATAIPDLTVSVGWRNFQENDSNALVAGLEFPLPLFDRNQGARKSALSAVNQVRYKRLAVQNQVQAALSTAYRDLTSAHSELTILTRDLLPGAESVFEAASLGYREGKFGFLDVLEAQRTLFEVRGQFVSALARCHLAKADIERLIARPLDCQPSNSDESCEVKQ